jgi:hypothetical protein
MRQFRRFFSYDSPKAIKADKFGVLNAINYMAPARSAGVGNLCSHASPACIELCLGRESGQAAMVPEGGTNIVRISRERKARYFMQDRQAYMREMLFHIANAMRDARAQGKKLVVRPNGSTDIAYESVRVMIEPAFAAELSEIANVDVPAGAQTIFTAFPRVQFVDYTKNPLRFNRSLPVNYDLTFSRSEVNEEHCKAVLATGRNVAVIFGDGLPETWNGYPVIDGDEHDLRHLDPKGVVVGLSPKGNKAKRSTNGFVVRNAA